MQENQNPEEENKSKEQTPTVVETPTVEEKEPAKLSVLQLAKLREAKQKEMELDSELAAIFKSKIEIKIVESRLEEKTIKILTETNTIIAEIEKEFGRVSVDLETGILTPIQ